MKPIFFYETAVCVDRNKKKSISKDEASRRFNDPTWIPTHMDTFYEMSYVEVFDAL